MTSDDDRITEEDLFGPHQRMSGKDVADVAKFAAKGIGWLVTVVALWCVGASALVVLVASLVDPSPAAIPAILVLWVVGAVAQRVG